MVERAPNGTERSLPQDKFYVPGSIMRVAVDNTQPITAGLPKYVDVFFDDSPVFRLEPDAAARGVKPLAWFDTASPLRSGWAWGQNSLNHRSRMRVRWATKASATASTSAVRTMTSTRVSISAEARSLPDGAAVSSGRSLCDIAARIPRDAKKPPSDGGHFALEKGDD
jgi:hypothetical protein